jgi:transketolase
MARHGIGYEDVAKAAQQCIENGQTPTHEHVRLIIGSGSNNTIGKYLRQWKVNQTTTTLAAAKAEVPKEISQLLKNLWEQLVGQAEKNVAVVEEDYIHQLNDMTRDYEKYKTNNRRWQQLHQQWTKEKENLNAEKIQLQKNLETVQEKNSQLRAKNAMLIQQIKDHEEQQKLFEKLFNKLKLEA